MALIETGNELSQAKSQLLLTQKWVEKASEARDRQLSAIFVQSTLLIQDAQRLYEERDMLRDALRDAWIAYQIGDEEFDGLFSRAAELAGIGEITNEDIVEWQKARGRAEE